MYVLPNLRETLTEERYLRHVGRGLVSLTQDLRECGCTDANVYRGMVKKVLSESGVLPDQLYLVVKHAEVVAEHEGDVLLSRMLYRATRGLSL